MDMVAFSMKKKQAGEGRSLSSCYNGTELVSGLFHI